jgi:HNH endonuclease
LGGKRIPLVGPQGIWKPAVCELPLSITTIVRGPYADAFDERTGTLSYAYRGHDPGHKDNVGLRTAQAERVPLVYFHSVEPGSYVAAYPAFVCVRDGDQSGCRQRPGSAARVCARAARQRLHQQLFRERVLRAYQERCALCSLRHQELLDAAHITPDSHLEGEPVVSNGVAVCKLHHAAFDRLFFAVRPDYAMRSGSSHFYYIFDALGSVIALTDGSGAIAASYTYDPYGNTVTASGSQATVRFASGYFDSAPGLTKFGETDRVPRVRWPEDGRFAAIPGHHGVQRPSGVVQDPVGLPIDLLLLSAGDLSFALLLGRACLGIAGVRFVGHRVLALAG